jgi:hypothetical protein
MAIAILKYSTYSLGCIVSHCDFFLTQNDARIVPVLLLLFGTGVYLTASSVKAT